jgi:mono/diheme cytochrome c family protein
VALEFQAMVGVGPLVRAAICFFAAALCSMMSATADESAAKVDFNRDIRPIFSKACYNCHGPDAAHRKAGLRLDERDAASKELETGAKGIVPGKPDESEVYLRITSTDAAERMPPKGSGPELSAAQIETIARWIEQGAPYAGHWSFAKPARPPLPVLQNKAWPRNAIDVFILAKQESANLHPAPEADRYALVRRLSLDLRGLPPTPAEVQSFVNDQSADAYEKVVDAFLSDLAYGERWARMWLDLARYADSKGLGSDPLRTIWRYRDWVIDAFNRNLTFDRFTMEQLAGDLLPGATLESRIATAFHRNTMTNTEGGTDDEEFRVAAVKDRVDTTMQVWMGLTLGCSKCHDHKFDPLSQAEYYRFFAIFNQTADNDQPDESPTIPAPTPDMESAVQKLDAEIARLRLEIDTPTPELAAAQDQWESGLRNPLEWVVLEPGELKSEAGAALKRNEDGSILVDGTNPDQDTYTITAETSLKGLAAFRLEVLPDQSLPGEGSGRGDGGRFVLSQFSVAIANAAQKDAPAQEMTLSAALADFSQDKFPVASALKQPDLSRSGWGVAPRVQEPHSAYFLSASPSPDFSATRLTIHLAQRYQTPRHTIGRFRLSVTTSTSGLKRLSVPAEMLAIIDLARDQRTPEQAAKLAAHYRALAPALQPVREKIAQLEKSRPAIPTVPVMLELPAEKRRTTRIMLKGNFMTLGETVQPGLPAAFHPLPKDQAADRRGLAAWIVDRQNPLTARVMVNRFWAQLFGTGIVETEEDFGTQGEPPSHPELLDWLAVEFMEPGAAPLPGPMPQRQEAVAWDMKRLLKLMVMSATYRQSSRITGKQIESDPRNRLLTRGPRFRLEAEMVRDQALALSGLLSRKTHGPSVYPPQPPGLWQAAFNGERTWTTSVGEDKYRRALYTLWRRTVPYPSMATFDAPSRELCTVRRIRTNTPLQAFVTLNDPVYVEAAQALARRIFREGGQTAEDRARFGLQLCLSRPPSAAQIEQVVLLYAAELAGFEKSAAAAGQLATDPLGPLPEGMPAAELAAWTVISNVLLNLDGVLTKG